MCICATIMNTGVQPVLVKVYIFQEYMDTKGTLKNKRCTHTA